MAKLVLRSFLMKALFCKSPVYEKWTKNSSQLTSFIRIRPRFPYIVSNLMLEDGRKRSNLNIVCSSFPHFFSTVEKPSITTPITTHTSTHIHSYTHACTYMLIHTLTHLHTHTHTCSHTQTYTHTYTPFHTVLLLCFISLWVFTTVRRFYCLFSTQNVTTMKGNAVVLFFLILFCVPGY